MIPLTRQEQLVILLLILASIAGLGIYFYQNSRMRERASAVLEIPAETNNLKIIYVDVGGAVWRPGVYKLKEGSRVGDVLEKAGPRPDANLDPVNNARLLIDGEKVLVPGKDEAGLQMSKGRGKAKININTAPKEELMSLPGIGAIRAEEIINYRLAHGRFKDIGLAQK